ncbi:MAG TPA: prolipoprotein diacylglyceryl transferase [Anaerolineales bacterium]|nr:prolipoprotein diacylglyceryl transferase [Anaerolineales bacterium]
MVHWNVDPEIYRIGPVAIRWYGLFFMLSFVCGIFILDWIYKKEKKPQEDMQQLLLYMLIGTMAGARLGHCLFYDPSYYLSNPLEILKVWEGGLASHGAAIGILLALYFYSRKHMDQPYLWLLDRMVIPVALAGMFIRTGNFFNSEIIGIPTQIPWAVIFERVDGMPRHPAQLYEALECLIIFVILFIVYKRRGALVPKGMLLGLFLILIFGFRFFVEFFKENQVAFEQRMPLHMGQILSIPAVLTGFFLCLRTFRRS